MVLIYVSPTSLMCDIRDYDSVDSNIKLSNATTVIHSAAATNVKAIEDDPTVAYDVNVLGTINIIKACRKI